MANIPPPKDSKPLWETVKMQQTARKLKPLSSYAATAKPKRRPALRPSRSKKPNRGKVLPAGVSLLSPLQLKLVREWPNGKVVYR